MSVNESSSRRSGRKKTKVKVTPADSEGLFEAINNLRLNFHLPALKTQTAFQEYATNLILDYSKADLNADNCVPMSNLSFYEEFDGKMSNEQLIQKWLKESNKRPVLFGPGKQGAVVFVEAQDVIYISVVVLSLFH